MTTPKRPVFINLFAIRFPVSAITSILHRFSGLFLVIAIPYFAWLLSLSVESQASYERAVSILASCPIRFAGILVVWVVSHHLFAGVRYLLIDIDVGVSRMAARRSALLVNVLALLVAALYIWKVIL